MSRSLTLDVPDELFSFLEDAAQKNGQTPENLAVQWLNTVTKHLTDDPVEQFIGAVNSPVTDWADQHDTYLGNVVMETMRGLTSSLTTDHHFEQAGFVKLLK